MTSAAAAHLLDVVYASVPDPTVGTINLKTALVDSSGSISTIAVEAQPLLAGLNNQEVVQVGLSNICFIKIHATDLALTRPVGWTTCRTIKPWPVASEVMTAYDDHETEITAASRVELELVNPRVFLGAHLAQIFQRERQYRPLQRRRRPNV